MIDPADVEDDKGRAALSRYALERVTSVGAEFEAAYGALETEFASRGELERREVIAGWPSPDEQRAVDGLEHRYHLLAARSPDGELAGARDCHTVVDRSQAICVVYLAHVWVAPEHRRQGLASLLRAAPITLGKGTGAAEVLLAAEMEPAVRDASDTLVRLVAYGRGGFRVVTPAALPYCQPDFRDPAAIDEPHPLPLLAVVRRLGKDEAFLPHRLASAYLRHLYAVFSTHCREEHLARPRAHALERLAAWQGDVPLLPLPASIDDEAALSPLWRDVVLPHHLPEL